MTTPRTTLHLLPLLLLGIGCAEPKDDSDLPTASGPGAGDDIGDLPPAPEPELPTPLPTGECLTKEIPPYEGVRHQCGGSIDIEITGSALGMPVQQDAFIEFGKDVEGDSYAQARVAACCAEYQYDLPNASNPQHWRACLYDAIQQTCATLPHYLWDMATAAKDQGKDTAANELTKLGNDIASADGQFDCIDTLFGAGPAEDQLNLLFDRSWNLGYDVWLNVNVLEILEISLPEDDGEWMTCTSTFENDETVLPDMSHGPVWDELGLDSGALALSGLELQFKSPADPTSALILGEAVDGSLMLGALQLRGGPLRVEGLVVERWRLGSLHDVTPVQASDGSWIVRAGMMRFVGAAIVDGETYTLPARNASDLVLRATDSGWMIDPFTVQYTADTGDVWTLESSALDFSQR